MNTTFQNFSTLTTLLRVLLIVSVIVSLVAVVAGVLQVQLLNDLRMGNEVSREQIEENDSGVALIGYAQLAILIISTIVFLRWVYRAHSNLRTIGARGMEFTPGWAVGWFFIPLANLWKPYQVMKELWHLSSVEWSDSGSIGESSSLPGIWGAVWVLSIILGRVSFSLMRKAESADTMYDATVVTIFSDGMDLVYSVVTLLLVIAIYKLQKRAMERSSEQSLDGVPMVE